jgi:hypothetical protein
MNGLDGWTCTIFRNENSGFVSSQLVIAAELALVETGLDCGPAGMLTYVWDKKVASKNPGYCFKCAGWERAGVKLQRAKNLTQKTV